VLGHRGFADRFGSWHRSDGARGRAPSEGLVKAERKDDEERGSDDANEFHGRNDRTAHGCGKGHRADRSRTLAA
jgi:hypothetical protein